VEPTESGDSEPAEENKNDTLPGVESDPEVGSNASSSEEPPSESSDAGSDTTEKGGSDSEDSEETLVEFGVEDDPRPNNAKLANPDGDLEEDRRVNVESETEPGEQEQLFPDVEDDQMTLGGERASNQCLF
jgi:hypothetical protein